MGSLPKKDYWSAMFDYFITSPPHLSPRVAEELQNFGGSDIFEKKMGVEAKGDLAFGYRACLGSRIANRVLLRIAEFPVENEEDLYKGVFELDWSEHLALGKTLMIQATTRHRVLNHSQYVGLKIKDGIVDKMRELHGERPDISKTDPDLRIQAHIGHDAAILYIDLSGKSLHQRGYRAENVIAPIKENIAAAMLIISGWPEACERGETMLDPMCGSGTIPIEAALIATHTAPGLLRKKFGFHGWSGHDPDLWEELRAEADSKRLDKAAGGAKIVGFDKDTHSVTIAKKSAQNAGLGTMIRFETRLVADARPVANSKGLIVCNMPYGERLDDVYTLRPTYAHMGRVLRENFVGYTAHLLTAHQELSFALGLKANRKRMIANGGIDCDFLDFKLGGFADKRTDENAKPTSKEELAPILNRLIKNQKRMSKWAKQQPTEAYRLYDADLPEFSFAVDIYGDWVHLQEYQAPKEIPISKTAARAALMLEAIEQGLNIPQKRIVVKVRERQRGKAQDEKQNQRENFITVDELGLSFLINLHDYLDTGIFLDHRPVRARIRKEARGKSFLNLFAYTGTATVYAAAGGATETTTVDLSNTYLKWAKRNMEKNGFYGRKHEFIRDDVMGWLSEEKQKYDLIFIDPPTFSNSKSTDDVFD
ncbi:bifunctional 23S rRNA (guanine(2069)-N(7))-methyltransferase RlmK/23S rRNA (guanine(2445)-N(2))-methyltransferase RlmL, partial [Myxococcota bacterium]|nr:bifunctional 23S rRNA (guanine(2069)-N(7))-methyltransferase RlmK/23S rRNA (guanine(2445)-N(2))-methyltransferase RlmL [Myxococcota bacterium]